MRTGKPFLIAGVPIAGLALHSLHGGAGFASAWAPSPSRPVVRHHRRSGSSARSAGSAYGSSALPMSSTEIDIDTLGLTPELRMMTEAFSSIPDEKTRHKQLLYMASKLADVGDDVRVLENKVPGCLSTVHVDCTAEEKEGEVVVNYVGDSDGLLTKGLLAMLIRGLSGCTPEQIAAVDPQFVKVAKISQTLTPGRNNGLLNMIAVMKKKASEATVAEANGDSGNATEDEAANGDVAPEEESEDAGDIVTSFEEIEGKPMYNAILSTLIPLLKPTSITLVDNSDQHAGHGGAKGWEESGESHFALDIVCEAFEGLNLVKRHQLIYMLLGEVMPKIHALEIRAKSTSEV